MVIVRFLVGLIRLLLFAITTFTLFCWLLFTNIFYKNSRRLHRGLVYRRFIIRILHGIVGAKVIVYGNELGNKGLVISNHRSYFDSIVLLKNMLAYPIAKKEVASWPLVGAVAKVSGVLFVNRNSKLSRKQILLEITEIFKKGYTVLNTPEGTTHNKPTTIPFKPGAFVIAAQLGIPVVPVAIDYKDLNDAWIGNDTFFPHFIRCFGKWQTEIKISYLDPILSENADELIAKSKEQIDRELIRFRNEWNAA